jgi:hypothetical protein
LPEHPVGARDTRKHVEGQAATDEKGDGSIATPPRRDARIGEEQRQHEQRVLADRLPRVPHTDRDRNALPHKLDAAQCRDVKEVEAFPDRKIDHERDEAQSDGGQCKPASAGFEVVIGKTCQAHQQQEDRNVLPPLRSGIDLRRLRLQDDHVANRIGGGRCGDDRKRQVRQRVAVSRPDRQVDRGERKARRGDHRMDDDDEADSGLCAAKIHAASLVPGFAATPPLHRALRASQAT